MKSALSFENATPSISTLSGGGQAGSVGVKPSRYTRGFKPHASPSRSGSCIPLQPISAGTGTLRQRKVAKERRYKHLPSGQAYAKLHADWHIDRGYATFDISGIIRNIEFFQLDKANPGITLGLGITSAGGLFSGSLTAYSAYQELKRANRISDIAGQRIAQIRLAQGVVETTSGAVMAGVRTVGLIGLSSTSKTIMAASHILGVTSTVVSCLQFTLLLARFVIRGVQSFKFMNGLSDNDAEAYKFLKSQLELTPEDIKQGVTQAAKEAAYVRAAGEESLTLLKNGSTDITRIVKLAREESQFKTMLWAFLSLACVLGIASFILTTVFTGGGFLILGFALMMAMNVMMTVADADSFANSAKLMEEASWKDKAIIVGMILLILTATAVGTFLTAGTTTMIVVLAAGLIMIGVQVYGVLQARQDQDKAVEKENPI